MEKLHKASKIQYLFSSQWPTLLQMVHRTDLHSELTECKRERCMISSTSFSIQLDRWVITLALLLTYNMHKMFAIMRCETQKKRGTFDTSTWISVWCVCFFSRTHNFYDKLSSARKKNRNGSKIMSSSSEWHTSEPML